jgi:uncharacterized damage-inducible protein DinB
MEQTISIEDIANIPAEAWYVKMPNGKGRTVAAMIMHIHNVRIMWLKGPKAAEPFTVEAARAALAESHKAVAALLHDGKFPGFGSHATAFLAYLIAHDSHHRGQIAMQCRLLGLPMSKSANFGLWEWGKMTREASA